MKLKIKEKAYEAKAWLRQHKQDVVATIGSGVVSGVVFSVIHALCNKKTGLGDGTTHGDTYHVDGIKIDGESVDAFVEFDADDKPRGFWVNVLDLIVNKKD